MSYKRPQNPDTPEVTAKYYLSNAKLMPEVIASRQAGKITDGLAEMILLLATRYANRPNFHNYSYRDDMVMEAVANLCQNAIKFDPEKSNNPFAYFTSCIHRSFLHVLGVEKNQRRIRDQLLIDIGENPSFSFAEEYNSRASEATEEGLTDLRTEIEEAKARMTQEAILQARIEAEKAAQAVDAALTKDLVELS